MLLLFELKRLLFELERFLELFLDFFVLDLRREVRLGRFDFLDARRRLRETLLDFDFLFGAFGVRLRRFELRRDALLLVEDLFADFGVRLRFELRREALLLLDVVTDLLFFVLLLRRLDELLDADLLGAFGVRLRFELRRVPLLDADFFFLESLGVRLRRLARRFDEVLDDPFFGAFGVRLRRFEVLRDTLFVEDFFFEAFGVRLRRLETLLEADLFLAALRETERLSLNLVDFGVRDLRDERRLDFRLELRDTLSDFFGAFGVRDLRVDFFCERVLEVLRFCFFLDSAFPLESDRARFLIPINLFLFSSISALY